MVRAREIARIASTYHVWRGEAGEGAYEDIRGFCNLEQAAALVEKFTSE